jgi:Holliday junction DNA helicase RuvB
MPCKPEAPHLGGCFPSINFMSQEPIQKNFYHETVEAPPSAFDVSLRPPVFSEFQGQGRVVELLTMRVQAAKQRGDVLDHVLLSGPPGLGKTSLAHIIVATIGSQIHCLSGPQIERPGDLTGVLTNLQHGDVLFIDEIHRMHPKIEEYLYPAMEDFKVDIMIDSGPNARSIPLTLNRFTLVGATTRSGMLTAPLRTRMGITCRLNYYEPADLQCIIERSAGLLDIAIEPEGALEIALRSRGTPRVANKLLAHVRDYAQIRADNRITKAVADAALSMIDIDADGLDDMDKRILEALIFKFGGGPVGLNTIAVAVAEDPTTVEEVHEPYLVMQGFLKRTPRGRVAMPAAYIKVGAPVPSVLPDSVPSVIPPTSQPELF